MIYVFENCFKNRNIYQLSEILENRDVPIFGGSQSQKSGRLAGMG